jgi:GntR family transcriptional regulator, transcriptional repressor for pyruvate dehydrogenase complex
MVAPRVVSETRLAALGEEIADLIRRGEVNPGQRLPSERDLAQRFRVGRPMIREALRGLERSRIIEIRDRSGAYVKPFHPDQLILADLTLLAHYLDDTDLLHAVEVRRINEPAIAELAARRREASHLLAMTENLERMRLAVARDEDTVAVDAEFHDLVVSAAGNPVLAQMMKSISTLLIRSREITTHTPAGPGKALAFHLGIYRAIEAGDADAARQAMNVHLDDVEVLLRRQLEIGAASVLQGSR